MKRELMTYADLEAEARLQGIDHVLFKIEKIVDWKAIDKLLAPTDYRKTNQYVSDSYAPMVIFRIMLLKQKTHSSHPKEEWLFCVTCEHEDCP